MATRQKLAVAKRLHQANLKQHSLKQAKPIGEDEGSSYQEFLASTEPFPRCSHCGQEMLVSLFNNMCATCGERNE